MSKDKIYSQLEARQQALIAIAVLLDGMDATLYLANDSEHGDLYNQVVEGLVKMAPAERLPYVAAFLRQALGELE